MSDHRAGSRFTPNPDESYVPTWPVGYTPSSTKAPAPTVPGNPTAAAASVPEPAHRAEPAREVTAHQVLTYLREHGPSQAKSIAAALRADLLAVSKLLTDLSRRNLVHKASRGWASAPTRAAPTPSAAARTTVPRTDRILAVVRQSRRAMTAAEIKAALAEPDAQPNAVHVALSHMHRIGSINRHGEPGNYQYTAPGRDQVIEERPATPKPAGPSKIERVLQILVAKDSPLTAREIWEVDKDCFGGADSSRVNTLLKKLEDAGRVFRVVDGGQPLIWCRTREQAEQAQAEIDAAIRKIEARRAGYQIENAAQHARHLRQLAAQTLIHPDIAAWLDQLAAELAKHAEAQP